MTVGEAVESGTPEAVAFRLLQTIVQHNPDAKYGREELLALYQECLFAVRGPVAEDLMAALGMEE